MAALARGRALAAGALIAAALTTGWVALALGEAGGEGVAESEGEEITRVPGLELIELPGVGISAWSPDSRWIATPGRGGVLLRTPAGERRGVKGPRLQLGFGFPARLSVSSDGSWLRYVTAAGPERGRGVWATEVRADGTGLRQTPLETEIAFPGWARGGWPLVFATGPYYPGTGGPWTGPTASLREVSGPGAEPEILLRTAGLPDEPVISPDGEQILFKQWVDKGTELWLADFDGSQRRLARAIYIPQYEWSPDGRRIAYAAVKNHSFGGSQLFVTGADGDAKPRRVGRDPVFQGPTWAPDGRWLTYSTPDGELRRIHPNGRADETIATFDGEEVRGMLWSPNGRYLAYAATEPYEDD